MLEAYIYDGLRTPFGRHAGALSRVRPDDLLAGVVKEVVARSGFAPEIIDDVSVGCASQAGEDSRNVARHALLLAGLPVETPGAVHNRLCGSGLNALVGAAHAITCGEADVCVAGGVESMTRAPFVVGKAEQAFAKDFKVFDSSLGARFPNPKIESLFGADTMPQTADNLARDYQLTREECDLFALGSQQKYAKAAQGRLLQERDQAGVDPAGQGQARRGRRRGRASAPRDHHGDPAEAEAAVRRRRDHGRQRLRHQRRRGGADRGQPRCRRQGRRQADGARDRHRPWPACRRASWASARCRRRKKALERAGLDLKDMDVIEINEAFAAQVLACLKGLGLPLDDSRVNPNGGAIAVGHPLGASGARLALTAARQLQRSGGRYALVSMCIGVGQGIAVILERM